LTDHHYLWPEDELQALRKQAALPESFLLFSGQEVTTADVGDVLVYGAGNSIGAGIRLSDLRRCFPDAALVLAHPWRGQARPDALLLFDPNLDAIEVFNRHHGCRRNRMAFREWQTWGFVGMAGTDTHRQPAATPYPRCTVLSPPSKAVHVDRSAEAPVTQ
jgi:hypothetical protein